MISNLSMYVAPQEIVDAQVAWQERVAAALQKPCRIVDTEDYMDLWCSAGLFFSQTCGYPLMTALKDKVRLVGKPNYNSTHSSSGRHCSLIVCREDSQYARLSDAVGAVGLINSFDSNSGMNLFRHTLSECWSGVFFSKVKLTGGHLASLKALRSGEGDLAAIDSVTYDYLAQANSDSLMGLRVLARSVQSPCLPYITSKHRSSDEAEEIRLAMNRVLKEFPKISRTLMISEVIPADFYDYEVLFDLERQTAAQGFAWTP